MTEDANLFDACRARWRDDELLRSSLGAPRLAVSPSTFDRFRDSLGSARVAILDTNYIMNQVSQHVFRFGEAPCPQIRHPLRRRPQFLGTGGGPVGALGQVVDRQPQLLPTLQ